MFLISAIKPKVEKKLKTCIVFFCIRLFRGGKSVQNKTSYVSLHCRFAGSNKNITKKKGEIIITEFH